jgi:RNA polymerase sigma-70 factor, ECF subfamily
MDRALEQALIEQAAAGDRASAEALIKAHQPSLFAYLLRLSGKPDIAEDITQDAFVRILTNLHRFDPRFRFSTWLFTIAKRLYVNAMQKHRPVYDSDIVGGWNGGAEVDDPAVKAEEKSLAQHCLTEALEGLTDEQRTIIILFHQQEWPISQIAQYMDMPEGTIKSHLHRGRKKMRRIYEESEATSNERSEAEAVVRLEARG